MSQHIDYNYQCVNCNEQYLPFNEKQRNCPKCSRLAPKGAPSIADIVDAAKANKELSAFVTMSLADSYVLTAMQVINFVDNSKKIPTNKKELDVVCSKLIKGMNFSDSKYRIAHTTSFINGVLREAYLRS